MSLGGKLVIIAGSQPHREQRSGVALKPRLPRQYAVLLLNDDYTPQDFVVMILQKYFSKTTAQAFAIMMKVHETGKGVAGIFNFEIAETKAAQVMKVARAAGHPLRATIEPETEDL